MLDFLPQWFQIFFFSMVPWLEARYVIPFSMLQYGWEWWQAFPLAIAGNIFRSRLSFCFFATLKNSFENIHFGQRLWIGYSHEHERKQMSRIRKYQYLGLFAFVALPVPFTGAWTGALIAYLFDLKFSKSLLAIFIGLILAAVIMIILTLYISWMLTYLGINIKG